MSDYTSLVGGLVVGAGAIAVAKIVGSRGGRTQPVPTRQSTETTPDSTSPGGNLTNILSTYYSSGKDWSSVEGISSFSDLSSKWSGSEIVDAVSRADGADWGDVSWASEKWGVDASQYQSDGYVRDTHFYAGGGSQTAADFQSNLDETGAEQSDSMVTRITATHLSDWMGTGSTSTGNEFIDSAATNDWSGWE